ncbi:MAG: hypothetical protein AAGE61_05455 [Pseudomonadota bacterium]
MVNKRTDADLDAFLVECLADLQPNSRALFVCPEPEQQHGLLSGVLGSFQESLSKGGITPVTVTRSNPASETQETVQQGRSYQLAGSFFLAENRHRLLHELQRVIDREEIGYIFAHDIWRAGYTASVAAYLAQIKNVLIATHNDAFLHHMNNPGVFEQAIRNADVVLSEHEAVLDHLSAFHEMKARLLWQANAEQSRDEIEIERYPLIFVQAAATHGLHPQ